MECLIGIKCKDFVLLAHDNLGGRSVLVMKDDQDKMFKLTDKLGMVICGESGDTVYFGELIQKNIQLYKMRHGYELSPHSAANFTRHQLAEYLRSRTPYLVYSLIGGFDEQSKTTSLFYMDYLASLVDVPYAAHGYGAMFTLSLLDRHYREDLTQEEAEELLVKCILEVQKRLIINLPAFSYYFIDANGISQRKRITAKPSEISDKEAESMEA